MNKGRRQELKMNKYKRRLKLYGLKEGVNTNLHAFRSHGKPCSCSVCQQPENNYNRAHFKKQTLIMKREVEHNIDTIMG